MNSTIYNTIRVVLADDHEIFRDGFNVMLKKQKEIELAGEAENGLELIELTSQVQPDVILTDIKMPRMDGIEATRILSEKFPQINIIALSMFDDEHLIIDMLEAGAKGYLLKNAHKYEILEAVKAVYHHETYYCNHTTHKLAEMIAKSRFNPYKQKTKTEFTDKEKEVIQLICRQFSNKEMATELKLSIRTIEGYREKIMEKMIARNTAGIVVYAIKHGIYKV
jgi:two-component system, NarL family, response regulator NreC